MIRFISTFLFRTWVIKTMANSLFMMSVEWFIDDEAGVAYQKGGLTYDALLQINFRMMWVA